LGEFTERNTKLIAISTDSHFSHLAWKNTPYNKGGVGNIQIPMVSDIKKVISRNYNVLHDEAIPLRGTFIIDEKFIVRHLLVNDFPIGRNVDEVIRIIDALYYNAKHGEVCPAGWNKGDEAITPSHKGVADYLASNAEKFVSGAESMKKLLYTLYFLVPLLFYNIVYAKIDSDRENTNDIKKALQIQAGELQHVKHENGELHKKVRKQKREIEELSTSGNDDSSLDSLGSSSSSRQIDDGNTNAILPQQSMVVDAIGSNIIEKDPIPAEPKTMLIQHHQPEEAI
ncbi:unnamed protein product, partial [Protopolystoma xenopodis]